MGRENINPTKSLKVERYFSKEGVHPYDEIEWELRDVVQNNWKTGEVVFEQKGVEFPKSWSMNATTIVTTKYFRGRMGTDQRETSLKKVLDRIADSYSDAAVEYGYMDEENAAIFNHELKWLLVNQHFSFNSPVWFNVGTISPKQVSACFILSVDDSIESILDWYKEEGLIFKGGSGAGVNLSKIRASKEHLISTGGTPSGPVSFMRGADATAGTIKSGGANRRSAKMVILDVDHPDIEEFIETKVHEEGKIRVLKEAGYDMEFGGKDSVSVQYQNANNSVRVNDKFMNAVERDEDFDLIGRLDGQPTHSVKARDLFRKIAKAAWECADPGIQYDDTINDWHTLPVAGKITASNPCSEYMSIDNSSCNLASLNLMKFVDSNNKFQSERFVKAVEHVITAMEISISFADFPTKLIGDNTRKYRQLGIGHTNMGAVLMSKGLAYDSPEGRGLAGAITSLMTSTSYRRSAEIAEVVGAYQGYRANAKGHLRVMRKHRAASSALLAELKGEGAGFVAEGVVGPNPEAAKVAQVADEEWQKSLDLGEEHGYRNSQASVLAPTGTIGFALDAETLSLEPAFSLVQFKKLVGGGSLQIVTNSVVRALKSLGYSEEEQEEINTYIIEHGTAIGAPNLKEEHYKVFDCAVGERSISPMGHLRMMAAAQPFLSGAISKTVNLPETATVEEIEDAYLQGWKLNLKAIAVYRDNCKVGQPLSNAKAKEKVVNEETGEVEIREVVKYVERPKREKLPRQRVAKTTSFKIASDTEGYLTTGEYEDGRLGEVFLQVGRAGSTLSGVMGAFSVVTSLALQYGVPVEVLVEKFAGLRFEPAGITNDPDLRMSQSILDYAFKRIALDYIDKEYRQDMFGLYTTEERIAMLNGEEVEQTTPSDEISRPTTKEEPKKITEGPAVTFANSNKETQNLDEKVSLKPETSGELKECTVCYSSNMKRSGACMVCEDCGTSSGCS